MPDNKYKNMWDLVVIILLIYTATYSPFRVCFIEDSSEGWFIFDCTVDSLFFIDIVLNFFTVLELPNGQYETSRLGIAKAYMKSWFFLDLFTTIPFQVIERVNSNEDSSIGDSKVLRLMRIPRLYRLLRILRLAKLVRVFKVKKMSPMGNLLKVSNSLKDMLKTIGFIVFLTHIIACLWFL